MKATQDSLDQLETKNSDFPNHHHSSITHGEGKHAIQESFRTIPFSYLNEQGSVNSVGNSAEVNNGPISHRRLGTEQLGNHEALIMLQRVKQSTTTSG